MHSRFILLLALVFTAASVSAHPALIGEYPERFPGKNLQQLRDDWEPLPEDYPSEIALLNEAGSLVADWASLTASDRRARITDLAAKNRRGDYRKRIANLALDMADLGDANPTEAAAYLEWRFSHLVEDDGYFDSLKPGAWDEKPAERDERSRQWIAEREKEAMELLSYADKADIALRPHWWIQVGALEFRHRRYREAEVQFRRVIDSFPSHPRAEVARLMLARLRFDEWRQEKRSYRDDGPKVVKLQNAWWEACQAYRDAHPQGRFLLDLDGWEAGYQLLNGNKAGAFRLFLAQCRDPDHPEVRRRAFQQIEWMLHDLEEVDELPWESIVREPLVALRLGYHLLDSRSQTDIGAIMRRRDGADHRVLESLVPDLQSVRARASRAWSSLDLELERKAVLYRGSFTPIRQVLHLWSLIARGHAKVAMGMEENPVTGAGADDMALARLFVRIKAGPPAEVVRRIEDFQKDHALSPLNRGLTLRLVDAWVELGRFEQALSLLWDMMEGHDMATVHEPRESNPALHLPGEVTQRVTAIFTFAPLDHLARAAASAADRPYLRAALCGALRVRYLSQGDYDASLKFATNEDFQHWQEPTWQMNEHSYADYWRDVVNQLQRLSSEAKDAGGWNALGEAWRRHSRLLEGGHVYLPAPYAVASLSAPSHELRSLAGYLHLPDGAAASMLDSRQSLTKAIECFEKGDNLVSLHDALRARAEVSPYWMDRAVETGEGKQSQALVAKIQREEIVPWTFRPADTWGEWQPGRTALWRVETEIASTLGSHREENWEQLSALKKLHEQVLALCTGDMALSQLGAELRSIRDTIKREAPTLKSVSLLNHIDDLSLLAAKTGIDRGAFTRYAELRFQGKIMPTDDPILLPLEDFVVFWNAAIAPSETPSESMPWRQHKATVQVERMKAFLDQYPQSVKREAALARIAINTLRMSRCHCSLKSNEKADVTFVVERGAPFDLNKVLKPIDQYEKEFPKGRYTPEMLLLRGLAAAEVDDWKTALTHLISILNNPSMGDLHLDASNSTAAIFMLLLEPAHRLKVMDAVKGVPGARDKLYSFLHTPSCGWRLHLIEDWLEAELRSAR